MLESIVQKGIKRAISKSELSQLKEIKKLLIKNKIWETNLLTINELKNYLRTCRQTLKVFRLQQKI